MRRCFLVAFVVTCSYSCLAQMLPHASFALINTARLSTYGYQDSDETLMSCVLMCHKAETCRSVAHNTATKVCQISNLSTLNTPTIVLYNQPSYKIFFKVPTCPTGWITFENRCYKYIDTPLTWNLGSDHCASLGGNLAVPHTLEHVVQFNTMTQCMGCYPWIGFSDPVSDQYRDVFNQPLSEAVFNATTGMSGIPECGYIDANAATDLFSFNCTSVDRFICEKIEF